MFCVALILGWWTAKHAIPAKLPVMRWRHHVIAITIIMVTNLVLYCFVFYFLEMIYLRNESNWLTKTIIEDGLAWCIPGDILAVIGYHLWVNFLKQVSRRWMFWKIGEAYIREFSNHVCETPETDDAER